MNKKEVNKNGLRSTVAMWGTRQQRCTNGNVGHAGTAMSSTAPEETSGENLPKVADIDTDQTVPIDRRILARLEKVGLWQQIQVSVSAHPHLDLPSGPSLAEMIQKSQLVASLVSGGKPHLAEELALSIKKACQEAGKAVRKQFDLAAATAPSKVDAVVNDLADAIAQMDCVGASDDHALSRFQKRANQFKSINSLKSQVKETTYEKLTTQLVQQAQGEYSDVLRQWSEECFSEYWKKELEMVRERLEKYLQDSRDFRSKIRICVDESKKRFNIAKERLTTLQSGNQVILEEASKAEFQAALMASYKVGSQSELITELRHDFEELLRELAEKRGMGVQQAQRMPFRALILALSETDIVDIFTSLILERTSDSHSFYESCQAYGLERLVSDLVSRSRITSWFDGHDNPRFGINRYEMRVVRMAKATNPKEAKIKELLKILFAKEGFQEIQDDFRSRSISTIRIYAGWPIGIEGGNPALLKDYKKSAETGHLPHLIGILPDTKAGEHAKGIMRLNSGEIK
jgi:hypothetical protein